MQSKWAAACVTLLLVLFHFALLPEKHVTSHSGGMAPAQRTVGPMTPPNTHTHVQALVTPTLQRLNCTPLRTRPCDRLQKSRRGLFEYFNTAPSSSTVEGCRMEAGGLASADGILPSTYIRLKPRSVQDMVLVPLLKEPTLSPSLKDSELLRNLMHYFGFSSAASLDSVYGQSPHMPLILPKNDEQRRSFFTAKDEAPPPASSSFYMYSNQFRSVPPHPMDWGAAEVPWLRTEDVDLDSFGSATAYAQREIARRLMLHASVNNCTNFALVHEFYNYGLGADLELLVVDVLHSMVLGRAFVLRPGWDRWAPGPCADFGWNCYFLPITSCRYDPVLHGYLTGPKGTQGYQVIRKRKGHEKYKVIWKQMRLVDLLISDVPMDLHPPSMGNASEFTKRHGLPSYYVWAQAQVQRYLLRAVQPWFAALLQHHIFINERQSLDPYDRPDIRMLWQRNARVVAIHLRNGDHLKDREQRKMLGGCAVFRPELYLDTAISVLKSPVIFVSFDNIKGVDELEVLYHNTSRDYHKNPTAMVAKFTVANFPRVEVRGRRVDSRKQIGKMLGKGHVIKVSFVNLFLSAFSDGWVMNDISTWCRIINKMRMTYGGRYQCPYIDVSRPISSKLKSLEGYCT